MDREKSVKVVNIWEVEETIAENPTKNKQSY